MTNDLSGLLDHQSREGWLKALPPWQAGDISTMLDRGLSGDALIQSLLSSSVAESTAPFGGNRRRGKSVFFDNFLDELHDFLCSDTRYVEERAAFRESLDTSKTGAVALVSATLATPLAVAGPVLAPVIVVALITISQLGLKAWCRGRTEERTLASGEGERSSLPDES